MKQNRAELDVGSTSQYPMNVYSFIYKPCNSSFKIHDDIMDHMCLVHLQKRKKEVLHASTHEQPSQASRLPIWRNSPQCSFHRQFWCSFPASTGAAVLSSSTAGASSPAGPPAVALWASAWAAIRSNGLGSSRIGLSRRLLLTAKKFNNYFCNRHRNQLTEELPANINYTNHKRKTSTLSQFVQCQCSRSQVQNPKP